jgi:hypothetical protein
VWSWTITGGTLGSTGGIYGVCAGSSLDNVGSNQNQTWKIKYGGTIMVASSAFAISNSATAEPTLIHFVLYGAGATNSQTMWAEVEVGGVCASGSMCAFQDNSSGTTLYGVGTAAVDSTASQTLLVSLTQGSSSASMSFTPQQCDVVVF